jgi:arabinogalactan oligomer/maltooligosaccharide transport system permease protein
MIALPALAALTTLAAPQVVLWHSYHADEQLGLEAAVQQWNRLHADQAVESQAIPFDGFSYQLEAAIPHGHGPDLFIFAHEMAGEWSRTGIAAPLDDKAVDPSSFLDGTIEPLRVDGKLYGVPLAFKSMALFYRTDLVAKPPATIDELLASCRSLARPGATDARYCIAYEAGSFPQHSTWLHGEGGSIFGADGRPRLASPEGIRALTFVRRLVDDGFIPDETNGAVVGELFNSGRAAYAINGPWFIGDLKAGLPFAVAPLPANSTAGHRTAPLLFIEAGMISAHARNPDGARAFLRWLAGPEGALIRAKVGKQSVADRAAWSDPAIAGNPILGAFRSQLASTVPLSNSPAMRVVWEPAQQALRRVLRGAADPDIALREADRRIAIALRPAPPEASQAPYVALLGLLLVVGAGLGVRRAGRDLRAPSSGAWAYLAPAMAAMVALVFVPFAVGAAMSLFHNDGASWRFVGLANFVDILASRDQPISDPLSFYFTLAVTALWTVANVALHVALGVMLALLLRNPLLKLRGVYRVLLIVPWAVPNYITALIWRGMFHRQFGAINGLLKLLGVEPVAWFSRFWTAFAANLCTNVWLGFPFMMVVTLGALSQIPKELEEAALLDGASRFQLLRRVILPLLRPALLPSVILGAVWTFNMFNVVFLVSGGEPDGATDILVSQAYRWAFTRGHRYGYAAAFAVLIFVVLVAQSTLARRASPSQEDA